VPRCTSSDHVDRGHRIFLIPLMLARPTLRRSHRHLELRTEPGLSLRCVFACRLKFGSNLRFENLAPQETRYRTFSRSGVLLDDRLAKGGGGLSVVSNVFGRMPHAFLACFRGVAECSAAQEIDTIPSMRKEEFERRAAEMKARMLAQRNRQAEEPPATSVRKARTKGGQEDTRTAIQSSETEVQALRDRNEIRCAELQRGLGCSV
jgi:hypothetical protein